MRDPADFSQIVDRETQEPTARSQPELWSQLPQYIYQVRYSRVSIVIGI